MPRYAVRRIIVDGNPYVWRRRHTHDRAVPAAVRCAEVLTIYREGHKRYPLRIQFTESDEWLAGYPQAGVLCRTKDGAIYNLNRPAVVSSLIRWLLASGWNPDEPFDRNLPGDTYSLLSNARAPREPVAGPAGTADQPSSTP